MYFKILHLILLIVPIVATVNGTFTFEPVGVSSRDEATRTVSKDKGTDDRGDYKLNKGYSSTYNVKDDPIKGLVPEDYKYDEKIVNGHDDLARNVKQEIYDDGKEVGYRRLKNGQHHRNDKLGDTKYDDGYDHKYQHGYRHSHGCHRRHRHRHRSDGKDQDGNQDNYGGYHRVRIVHDRKEKNDKPHRCNYGNCKYGGYRYDDEFEYQYGNDGTGHDVHNYNGGSHDGYKDNSEYNMKHSLGHDHDEGIDDHGSDYHYGYAQSGSDYGKDYPGFPSNYHYHHHQPDDDHTDHLHRHGLVPRNY